MQAEEFRLPDVGEGLTEAEIVRWHVEVGDVVAMDHTLVEIETAKSVVELPSPFAGVVHEILVPTGQTAQVGDPLIVVDTSADPLPEAPVPAREPVLVGYGVTEPPPRRRHIHVDRTRSATTPTDANAPKQATPLRTPIKGVQRAMADAMVRSAFTAPHAAEWVTVDVTAMMDLVRALRDDRSWADLRVTPLAFVARALVLGVRRHPRINASWDADAGELVEWPTVNLGIAAATPRGLVVPNIKSAELLTFRALTERLRDLVAMAREGRTQPSDMQRGTITLTNIGALGVDGGLPILNPGEAAILAFGAVRKRPMVVGSEVVVREVSQLTLAFDHRIVDGELGAELLTFVAGLLEDPRLAFVVD